MKNVLCCRFRCDLSNKYWIMCFTHATFLHSPSWFSKDTVMRMRTLTIEKFFSFVFKSKVYFAKYWHLVRKVTNKQIFSSNAFPTYMPCSLGMMYCAWLLTNLTHVIRMKLPCIQKIMIRYLCFHFTSESETNYINMLHSIHFII